MMKIELCVCYIFQIFSLQKSNHSTFQNKLIKTENVPHGLVHNNLDSNIIVTMGITNCSVSPWDTFWDPGSRFLWLFVDHSTFSFVFSKWNAHLVRLYPSRSPRTAFVAYSGSLFTSSTCSCWNIVWSVFPVGWEMKWKLQCF